MLRVQISSPFVFKAMKFIWLKSLRFQTFFRFGFGGSYIIYDLIPVHLLQRYFLRMAGFPVVTAYKPGEDASSIEISKHKSILLEGGFVTLVSDTKVLAQAGFSCSARSCATKHATVAPPTQGKQTPR